MGKYAVIIAAAGKGERFGAEHNKAYTKLEGRPVFLRSIELFMSRDDVSQLILVVAPEEIEDVKKQYGANLGFMGVKLVQGGKHRSDSVRAGLAAVNEDIEFVAVHDAARPCTSAAMIDAVFAEAAKSGAAILAVPLTGTIKKVSGAGVVEKTTPREGLHEAQTPQVFKKNVLQTAYEKIPQEDTEQITDDASAVEKSGHDVTIVKSAPTNIKITVKADLPLAGAILKSRPTKPKPRLGAFEEAQW